MLARQTARAHVLKEQQINFVKVFFATLTSLWHILPMVTPVMPFTARIHYSMTDLARSSNIC